MTFRQFAFHNVFRNKRLYVAYFLSSLLTVMVFFTFVNFAFHPELSGEEMNSNVTQGMTVAGGIIYVFSFFFILYSMSSFLQSRKREFGLLMIQGMSNQQIRWMVFLENMIIGFFATILGTALGLVFSKVILLLAENLLQLEGTLYFYFPARALMITFCSFIILFFFISIFVTVVLRTNRLVKLIKSEKMGKSAPKASLLLTLIAILLLGSGYTIALIVKGPVVVVALFPVAILVIIGTYLLFTQMSVYMIKKMQSNKGLFWKKTNMLLFSDLAYRMKDNARAFFMVAIISTVAFSAIGTLVGLNSYLTTGIEEANPISFEYRGDNDKEIKQIEETFADHHITVEKGEVELTYFENNGDQILITTPEMYNTFAKLAGENEIVLQPNEVTAVKQRTTNMLAETENLSNASILLADGSEVRVDQSTLDLAKPNILPSMRHYFIVGDAIFEQLAKPVQKDSIVAWQVIDGKQENIIEAGRQLSEKITGFSSVDSIVYNIHVIWSPILFVGLFIGIVFFVSAGSFLYFRLYTDLDEDKAKFSAINRIGLTGGEMNAVISKQMALLFFAPIVVALIHGAVALTALSHMFGYNLFFESVIVLGSFLAIQVMYFVIVHYFYTKQVRKFIF